MFLSCFITCKGVAEDTKGFCSERENCTLCIAQPTRLWAVINPTDITAHLKFGPHSVLAVLAVPAEVSPERAAILLEGDRNILADCVFCSAVVPSSQVGTTGVNDSGWFVEINELAH